MEYLERKSYSDQTGRFPSTLNRGMKYVMIFCVYDANHVKDILIKKRTEDKFLQTYEET